MELSQIIQEISKVQINRNTTFQTYKCTKCKDTGWIVADQGKYKRCDCYEEDYTKRLWENFGINPQDVKLLRDYKPYNEKTTRAREKAADYIKNFKKISEEWICMMGQPGGGKTHIVLSIGKALLEQKIKVVYMPYLEATRELKSNTMDDEYYNKLINRYKKAEVLIIDDLFKDKVKKGRLTGELTESDMKHIYPIINYRYSNKIPTLISTECTPQMLIDLDEALAGRILEMCGKKYSCVFDGECNYRLREFMN